LRVAIVIAQLEILLGAARLEQRDKEAAVWSRRFPQRARGCLEAGLRRGPDE